jgi:hypothetical protein
VYARVLNAEPVAPSLLRPEVDADLESILLRCMAKEASRRFDSTMDLRLALERYLQRRSRPVLSLAPSFTDANDAPIHIPGVHRRWPGALALLALALAAGTFYERDRAAAVLDVDALRDRATTAVLSIDAVRKLDERYSVMPRLDAVIDVPTLRARPRPYVIEPRGVVARVEPAFDSSGSTVRAEPELAPRTPSDEGDAREATRAEKEQRYHDYLRQNGFVPLRDVLQGGN